MIITYQEKSNKSNKAIGREFNIQTKQVRDWKSKKAELIKASPQLLMFIRSNRRNIHS